jgi:hypothetical protein
MMRGINLKHGLSPRRACPLPLKGGGLRWGSFSPSRDPHPTLLASLCEANRVDLPLSGGGEAGQRFSSAFIRQGWELL